LLKDWSEASALVPVRAEGPLAPALVLRGPVPLEPVPAERPLAPALVLREPVPLEAVPAERPLAPALVPVRVLEPPVLRLWRARPCART